MHTVINRLRPPPPLSMRRRDATRRRDDDGVTTLHRHPLLPFSFSSDILCAPCSFLPPLLLLVVVLTLTPPPPRTLSYIYILYYMYTPPLPPPPPPPSPPLRRIVFLLPFLIASPPPSPPHHGSGQRGLPQSTDTHPRNKLRPRRGANTFHRRPRPPSRPTAVNQSSTAAATSDRRTGREKKNAFLTVSRAGPSVSDDTHTAAVRLRRRRAVFFLPSPDFILHVTQFYSHRVRFYFRAISVASSCTCRSR